MVVSKHITGPPAPNADLLSVMHDRMRADDQILSTLRSGQGASLTIRYYLGRKRHAAMRPPTVMEPVRSAEERPDPSESSRSSNGRASHAGQSASPASRRQPTPRLCLRSAYRPARENAREHVLDPSSETQSRDWRLA